MKVRIADSSFHAVAVQNVRFVSLRTLIPKFPGALRACRVESKA
jgi:hypothetical protein